MEEKNNDQYSVWAETMRAVEAEKKKREAGSKFAGVMVGMGCLVWAFFLAILPIVLVLKMMGVF